MNVRLHILFIPSRYFLSIYANINCSWRTARTVSGKPSNSPAGSGELLAHAQFMFSASVRCWSAPRFGLGHVSVTELGQGQKAAALIETRRNLEIKKWTQWTWWWPVRGQCFPTMCLNCFYIMHRARTPSHTHSHTGAKAHSNLGSFLRTHLHPASKRSNCGED